MTRTSLTLAAALGALLPLGSAFAATADGNVAQTYASFDRAAQADLRHAAADLATRHRMPDGSVRADAAAQPAAVATPHALLAAARNWVEKAETELLNRASFRDDGRLTQGEAIVPDSATSRVIDARRDLARGDIRDARTAIRQDVKELRSELPRA